MEKYHDFGIEDFVVDDEFRKWVVSPDESDLARWSQYISQNPGKKNIIRQATLIVKSLEPVEDEIAKDRIDAVWGRLIKSKHSLSKRNLIVKFYRYAAVFVIAFFIGIGVYVSIKSPVSDYSETYTEITVPYGERSQVTLYDGTKVWLNSGTTFKFPKSFNDKARTVSISGEAFFDVCKGKVPFIVSSEYGNIKVLGTRFNVRAYNNLQFQTTLVEGKIQFYNSNGNVIIQPNQQLQISESGNFVIGKIDCNQISSWTEGLITFVGEPLSEVFKKLERHYDITIEAEGSISSICFTGQIMDESIEEIMVLIDRTKPIKYKYDRKSRILTITDKN